MTTRAAAETASLQTLTATEARILGCLIEKAAITPDVYPLTLNALVQACNQKTSREPVMHLEPGEIGHALRDMEARGLVKLDPFSQRAPRWSHAFDAAYATLPRQRALLCILMLRGPQTVSELYTRCERLADFPVIDDVRDSLERLIARAPSLVVRIPRSSGQREDRYTHLLCGPVDLQAYAFSTPASATHARGSVDTELSERVAALEADVAALKQRLADLAD
ncbi:MAG: DUF480 domain-containing protein [Proteobacteria bacterium]|nr:DUF480 domain-containing protein [Pseudomonadota bacterium]